MRSNRDNFYFTMFSNTSMKAYPNSTIGAFTLQLAHEVDVCTDSWEVRSVNFCVLRLA